MGSVHGSRQSHRQQASQRTERSGTHGAEEARKATSDSPPCWCGGIAHPSKRTLEDFMPRKRSSVRAGAPVTRISTRFHPIIYVRGYAMSRAEQDETTADPFCGFNLGSTVY